MTRRFPARRRRFGVAAVAVLLVATASVIAGQTWQSLALASFEDVWRTVNDSYYDPTFGGLDWTSVRDELRPRVEAATTPDEARAVIRTMLGRLHQSHFNILAAASAGRPTGDATLDVELRVVDGAIAFTRVEAAGTAARSGLRTGDRLVSVDGRAVETWRPPAADRLDVRAESLAWWRNVSDALRGPAGSTAVLVVRDAGGRDRQIRVSREAEAGELVTLGNIPPLRVRTGARELRTPARHRVGVITFNLWLPAIASPVAEAIDTYRAADGLVMDLRGNPGGLAEMIRGIAGHLLSEPALLGRMKMRDTELEFRANPRRSTPDGRRVEPFAGPVAILIDELTGSSSECFAGGLQSLGRARIFGVTSMGQALPASTRALPNGDVLLYVVGDFATSTGHRLEGTGVVPDEPAPVTIASLSAGRDAPLDAALRWIDSVSSRPASARP